MNSILSDKMVNSYFRFLKDWDSDSKNNLITKLKSSMTLNSIDKYDFSACFGAWDDSKTADEIINEIKEDRVNHKEIEEF